jgi:hypothetical protein
MSDTGQSDVSDLTLRRVVDASRVKSDKWGTLGESLPEKLNVDNYLGRLPGGAGDDAFRAAILLRHARNVGGAALDMPTALWTLDGLHNYRRITPKVLRDWLELAGAPAHIYSDFVRLCPGAIAPERA